MATNLNQNLFRKNTIIRVPSLDEYAGTANSVSIYSIRPNTPAEVVEEIQTFNNATRNNLSDSNVRDTMHYQRQWATFARKMNRLLFHPDKIIDLVCGGFVDKLPNLKIQNQTTSTTPPSLIANAIDTLSATNLINQGETIVRSPYKKINRWDKANLGAPTIELYIQNTPTKDYVSRAVEDLLIAGTGRQLASGANWSNRLFELSNRGDRWIAETVRSGGELVERTINLLAGDSAIARDVNTVVSGALQQSADQNLATMQNYAFQNFEILRPNPIMVVYGGWLAYSMLNITNVDVEFTKSFINIDGLARPTGAKIIISTEFAIDFEITQFGAPSLYTYDSDSIGSLNTGILAKLTRNIYELTGQTIVVPTNFATLAWQNYIDHMGSNNEGQAIRAYRPTLTRGAYMDEQRAEAAAEQRREQERRRAQQELVRQREAEERRNAARAEQVRTEAGVARGPQAAAAMAADQQRLMQEHVTPSPVTNVRDPRFNAAAQNAGFSFGDIVPRT